jgi:hypothetical protein
MKQIFALINIRRDKKIRSDSASVWNSWIYGWVMHHPQKGTIERGIYEYVDREKDLYFLC